MNRAPAPASGAADPAVGSQWHRAVGGAHRDPLLHEIDERDDAAQLAVMFAVDYMSFDEDEPQRRQQVLSRYLFAEPGDHGWPGVGRQRAEFAAAGHHAVAGDLRWVDVRVRVTPYRRRPPTSAPPEPSPPEPSAPPAGQEPLPTSPAPEVLPPTAVLASAPAPDPLGWIAAAAVWYRLSVPVRRSPTGALFVDLAASAPDGRA